MTKHRYFCTGLIILFLVACGGKEREPIVKTGQAGQAVSLEVLPDDLQPDYLVEWSFTELPQDVVLNKYDFQPINTSPQISFTPPDSGMYHVEYKVFDGEGKEIANQPFVLKVKATATEETPVTEQTEEDTGTMAQPKSEPEPTPEKTTPPPKKSTPKTAPVKPKPTTLSGSVDRADLIPKIPGRYTVQVSSWRTFNKAEAVANTVKKLGYDAYIQRAKFPDTNKVWYRVRVGSFSSYEAAKVLRNKLQAEQVLSNQSIWIDFQRKDT